MPTKPRVVRFTGMAIFGDDNQVKRAQSFSSTTDFTQERLLELANKGVSEVIDTAAVSASLECNDYGGIDNFMIALGQGYYDGTINPIRVFTDADFEKAIVDWHVQISADDVVIDRSTWLGGMYLTGFTIAHTVDGVSTETYDYEGEQKRIFLNTYKDISLL